MDELQISERSLEAGGVQIKVEESPPVKITDEKGWRRALVAIEARLRRDELSKESTISFTRLSLAASPNITSTQEDEDIMDIGKLSLLADVVVNWPRSWTDLECE